jgi:hypothetical protein
LCTQPSVSCMPSPEREVWAPQVPTSHALARARGVVFASAVSSSQRTTAAPCTCHGKEVKRSAMHSPAQVISQQNRAAISRSCAARAHLW